MLAALTCSKMHTPQAKQQLARELCTQCLHTAPPLSREAAVKGLYLPPPGRGEGVWQPVGRGPSRAPAWTADVRLPVRGAPLARAGLPTGCALARSAAVHTWGECGSPQAHCHRQLQAAGAAPGTTGRMRCSAAAQAGLAHAQRPDLGVTATQVLGHSCVQESCSQPCGLWGSLLQSPGLTWTAAGSRAPADERSGQRRPALLPGQLRRKLPARPPAWQARRISPRLRILQGQESQLKAALNRETPSMWGCQPLGTAPACC